MGLSTYEVLRPQVESEWKVEKIKRYYELDIAHYKIDDMVISASSVVFGEHPLGVGPVVPVVPLFFLGETAELSALQLGVSVVSDVSAVDINFSNVKIYVNDTKTEVKPSVVELLKAEVSKPIEKQIRKKIENEEHIRGETRHYALTFPVLPKDIEKMDLYLNEVKINGKFSSIPVLSFRRETNVYYEPIN